MYQHHLFLLKIWIISCWHLLNVFIFYIQVYFLYITCILEYSVVFFFKRMCYLASFCNENVFSLMYTNILSIHCNNVSNVTSSFVFLLCCKVLFLLTRGLLLALFFVLAQIFVWSFFFLPQVCPYMMRNWLLLSDLCIGWCLIAFIALLIWKLFWHYAFFFEYIQFCLVFPFYFIQVNYLW